MNAFHNKNKPHRRNTFPLPDDLDEVVEKRVKRKYSYPSANEYWEEHIIIKKYHGSNFKHNQTNKIYNEDEINDDEDEIPKPNDTEKQPTFLNILMVLSNKIIKILCYLGILSCAAI